MKNPFHTKYTVYLPKELNLERLLIAKPIEVSYLKGKPRDILDRAYYLLGQIYNSRESLKAQGEILEGGWTRLNAEYLKKIVKNYKQYFNYFLDNEIVQCDGSYSNFSRNAFSMSYRFNPVKYSSGQWKSQHIYDESLLKTIFHYKSYDKDKQRYKALYSWFHDLEYDQSEAEGIMNKLYKKDARGRHMQEHLLLRMHDPNLWTFKTCKTNRLFTPITNLKRELRAILTYKGQRLHEIDIKNSIPYFSLVLLSPDIISFNPIIEDILTSSNKPLFTPSYLSTGSLVPRSTSRSTVPLIPSPRKSSYHIMLGKCGNLDVDLLTDFKAFRKAVLSGKLYQLIANEWNTYLKEKKYNRKKAKYKLLTILNSPVHFKNKEREVLEALFPNVMKLFDTYSSGYFRTKKHKNKTKPIWKRGDLDSPFALFTQKLEAYFLLDVVCKRISEEYPHVPLYTVHDSILTIKEYVPMVKYVMEEESIRLFNEKISLKVK